MSKKRRNKAAQSGVFGRLADLYRRMEQEYDRVRQGLDFSCAGCADNCCTSHFQHHTHVEWAYLWKGMHSLPQEQRERYLERARQAVAQARSALAQGLRPKVMCPLNDEGLCGLYAYRTMICRMHGTANRMARPDGQEKRFPGCFRFERAVQGMDEPPCLDRTPFYRELAALEMEYLKRRGRGPVKVDMTLAEMLVQGPPRPSGASRSPGGTP